MKSRIPILLLISGILLCFNVAVQSNDFADEVKEIEKEVVAVEPVHNVVRTEEVREYLNQFYHEVCNGIRVSTFISYFTTNVRLNTGGKRVSFM